jgi:hypothetical protein
MFDAPHVMVAEKVCGMVLYAVHVKVREWIWGIYQNKKENQRHKPRFSSNELKEDMN